MAKMVKKSPAPLYFAAAVWVLWGLTLPLYSVIHIALATVVSALAAQLGKCLFPDVVYELPTPTVTEEPKQAQAKAEPQSMGNPEIDALIAERDKAVSEMKRLNDNIPDPVISRQIDRLEETTRKIIAQVVAEPKKLPQIRRFMSYYLPTTLKLLNAYDRMDSTGVSGTNIDTTKTKIEEMLDSIVAAFDKQLDSLFADEALDISSDITVMEQLLAREGLGGEVMGGV